MVERSLYRTFQRSERRRGRLLAASLSGLATLAVGLFLVASGPVPAGFGATARTLVGVGSFGAVGLAARGEGGSEIERLTAKIRRFEAGEDVTFDTDRDDEVGELYDAVSSLAGTVRDHGREADRAEHYRARLYEITASTELTDDEKIERLLALGCERLGVENGHVVSVDQPSDRHEVMYASGTDLVTEGAVTDLSETFCRKTVQSDGVLGMADTPAAAGTDDPAYRKWGIGCYIGGNVETSEGLYGTVCFASEQPRERPFSAAEKAFVDLVARWVSHVYERRKREQELERTRDLLEQAQSLASVAGWEIDLGTDPPTVVSTDQGFRIYERPVRETFTLPEAMEPVHPDDRERLREAVDRASEDGESYDLEVRLVTEGTQKWVRVIGEPVFADGRDGEIVAVRGSTQDITDRKERERELATRSAAMEGSIDGMAILDDDEEYVFVNQAHADVYGYDDPEAFVGEDWRICYSDEECAHLEADVIPVVRSEGHWRGEATGLRADGTTFPQEVSLTRLDDGGVVCVVRDITERKERERDLTETKRRLELALEGTNTGIYDWNMETGEVEWDETAERIVGLEPGGFGGTFAAFEELAHPDDLPRVEAAVERAVENDELYQAEFRLEHADGGWVWIEARGRIVTDDGTRRMVGINHDVTERKENERELRERERELERTKALLEQAQSVATVGGWELDVRTDPPEMVWTDEVYRIYGLGTDAEVGVDDAIDFYHPDDRERVREAVERAIEEAQPYDHEVRLVTADGDQRWVNSIGVPVTEDGEVVAVRGSIQDITEGKERERELARQNDLFEKAQEIADVGAWEYDVPDEASHLSAETLRIHGLGPDAELSPEKSLGYYHPDDRDRVREAFERAVEDGEPYDLEVRLVTEDGDLRWVQTRGDPQFEDGEVVRVRGTIQDVTDRKERERALESLHESARGLLGIETIADAADLVVETATAILDVDGVAIYRLDETSNRLTPTARSDGFADHYGETAVGPDADSPLWDCFVAATPTVFDGTDGDAREEGVGGLLVPLAERGVFAVVTADPPVDGDTRRLVETLVATAAAAFERIESESTLAERDEELAAQNRRLERQIRVTDLIRRIDQSLVEATTRAEVERVVCERLVEDEDVSFAWVGAQATTDDRLEPRAWAGTGEEYLDTVSLGTDATEPAASVARTGEPAVVANVVDHLQADPWAEHALAQGFSSVVAVPLSFDEYRYGVLAVYADQPEAFTDLERAVFAELGVTVANSINAVEAQRALYADTLVELTLAVDDPDAFLARVASGVDCAVTYDGVATHTTDETRLFLTAETGDADAVAAVLGELVAVTDFRPVSESETTCRFEVTVAEETVVGGLVGHGASPRSVRATADGLTVVADLPPAADVRTFVGMLADRYGDVRLESRRDVERAAGSRADLVSTLLEGLTDRQLEALRTAYFAGFFEWPRESTGEDVAAMLGVTQPTVNRHLRLAQRTLLAELFEDGAV